MFRTILVPLDGSSRSEAALPLATRIARHTGAGLVLVRVVSFAAESWPAIMTFNPLLAEAVVEADLAEATEYLEKVAASPVLKDISVRTTVYHGPPASTILAAAVSSQSDLIVLCRHGATGLTRWVMGSTAEKVARHAPVPVLVVHEDFTSLESVPAQPLRMLIPFDGSANAQSALEPGAALLISLAAPGQKVILHLVQVLKLPYPDRRDDLLRSVVVSRAKHAMSQTVTRLQEGSLAPDIARHQIPITWSVLLGTDIAGALLRVAEAEGGTACAGFSGRCELIAISTHGRGGLRRWVMGSVAERVLSATTCPILIVHPEGREKGEIMSEESNDHRCCLPGSKQSE